jgi:hypothetical protein
MIITDALAAGREIRARGGGTVHVHPVNEDVLSGGLS